MPKNPLRVDQSPSEQDLSNRSFDLSLDTYTMELVGSPDPVGAPSRRLFPVPVGIDGSLGGPTTSRYDLQSPIYYVGSAPAGATEGSSLWTIKKYDMTSNPYSGKIATEVSWTGRAGATYV